MKLRIAGIGLALMMLVASSVEAKIKKLHSEQSHDMRVSTFCIEGYVFVIATSDVGQGGGTAVTQIYHAENGKNIPMRCSDLEKTRQVRAERKP